MFNEELRIENYKSFLIYICVIREICERKFYVSISHKRLQRYQPAKKLSRRK